MAKINSCAKGKNNERELKTLLNKRFPNNEFKRTIQSGAYLGKSNYGRSSSLTEEQQTVFLGDVFANGFKFIIEHKAYKTPFNIFDFFNESSNINKWIEQVLLDSSRANKKPMLIVKFNMKQRIVFLNEPVVGLSPNFIYNNWGCYWLSEVLTKEDDFFF